MRKCKQLQLQGYTIKVMFDNEYQEYQVKCYEDNVWLGEATTYFTDDKDDAYETAENMLNKLVDPLLA